MQHKIIGSTMPVLEMTLEPGDSIIAEAGELSWMTSSIELHTSTSAGATKASSARSSALSAVAVCS
jgi:uncharacterized protein (AIM24 family)